ncbi:sugar phosphate isomerase/epimerase family protein [Tautonia sociabilis]|uniref:Sugar phosphate isomerase/epimerase n=1 Tax=Tautonia sociabilis TaxID=2080755 RepID=A0A432MLQ1_9BACT|nr:sugar phosphate isomerase/epimerase family protein [Tautonia sociabilis]RUL88331.1 sugar phosphate isomerase/epimerase [Tautonia sociabilis]
MIRFGICNELFEGWDLARTCASVKRLGYEGIELAPFTLAPLITDLGKDRREQMRRTIADSGLETIGLHWLLAKTEGYHLTSPDPFVRARTQDYLKALIEATRDLGGSLMVFGSPKQRDIAPDLAPEEGMRLAAEVISGVSDDLEAAGVDLCLEPLSTAETNFLTSIAETRTLIDRVGHPRVTLHLDVKAMSSDPGGTVPDLIRAHGGVAGHFHANDPNLRGPGMGAVDFGPIMQALVASGYDRWVSVEVFDFSPGAEETARQSIETLRRTLEAARGA